MVNLGLVYFEAGMQALKVIERWLSLYAPDYWDQEAFTVALEAIIDEDAELEVQVYFPENKRICQPLLWSLTKGHMYLPSTGLHIFGPVIVVVCQRIYFHWN